MAQARHFFECRVFAYKGTREAELRNSIYIYIPSKPPFGKGRLVASVPLAHLAVNINFFSIPPPLAWVLILIPVNNLVGRKGLKGPKGLKGRKGPKGLYVP